MACRPMPPSEPSRVFISYTHNDGTQLARRLQEALATQFDVWLDTQRLTAGDMCSREIEAHRARHLTDDPSVLLALTSPRFAAQAAAERFENVGAASPSAAAWDILNLSLIHIS